MYEPGLYIYMTPTVIGQKLELLVKHCSHIKRTLDEVLEHLQSAIREKPNAQGATTKASRDRHLNRVAGSGNTKQQSENEGQDPQTKPKGLHLPDLIQLSLAVLTAVAVFISALGYKKTVETYNLLNRPYLGIESIAVSFGGTDEKGTYIVTPSRVPTSSELRVALIAKNYGSVPGSNVHLDWEARVDNKPIVGVRIPANGSFMFPGQKNSLVGAIDKQTFQNVMKGTSTFEVEVRADYDGAKQTYHYCEREQFSPSVVAFLSLGEVCSQPWNKGPTT